MEQKRRRSCWHQNISGDWSVEGSNRTGLAGRACPFHTIHAVLQKHPRPSPRPQLHSAVPEARLERQHLDRLASYCWTPPPRHDDDLDPARRCADDGGAQPEASLLAVRGHSLLNSLLLSVNCHLPAGPLRAMPGLPGTLAFPISYGL